MINSEQIQALRAAAEKATTLDLDSAQIERGNDGYYECPVCCGAGEVEAKTDFCNIDGVALGVQFYGIGEHHGAAEAYFRAAKPAAILSLLAERDTDKALIAEQDAELEREREKSRRMVSRIAELEARTHTVKLPKVSTERQSWTTWDWIQHLGGRYQNGNPEDYIKFGSVYAVEQMLKQFSRTVYAICQTEIVAALEQQLTAAGITLVVEE